ncbi:MAG: hypothetical protein AAGF06_04465, partial [Pseudomonadota bacterium]
MHIFKSEQELNDRFTMLDDLTTKASYYDDMLTISSNTFALTGDEQWRERYNHYNHYNQMIRTLLKDTSSNDSFISSLIDNLDKANNVLMEIERDSLLLSTRGKKKEALALLASKSYKNHKKIYLSAMSEAKSLLNRSNSALIHQNSMQTGSLLALIFLSFVVIFSIWYYFKHYINQVENKIQLLTRLDQLSGLLNRK